MVRSSLTTSTGKELHTFRNVDLRSFTSAICCRRSRFPSEYRFGGESSRDLRVGSQPRAILCAGRVHRRERRPRDRRDRRAGGRPPPAGTHGEPSFFVACATRGWRGSQRRRLRSVAQTGTLQATGRRGTPVLMARFFTSPSESGGARGTGVPVEIIGPGWVRSSGRNCPQYVTRDPLSMMPDRSKGIRYANRPP